MVEIVEAKGVELIYLRATMKHRDRDDKPDDPMDYAGMHDPEGNEFCVS